MPSSSAASFAGGGATLRPRPRGLSGRVSSNATSCRSRRAARARRRRTAPSRRRRSGPSGLEPVGCGRSVPSASLAVLGVGAVDDQDAVEMVELVLDDARGQPFELEANVLAASVLGLRARPGRRARPARARPGGRGSPPRRSQVSSPRSTSRGFTTAAGLVLVGLEDEEPPEHADLGRREPDPVRVVHQRRHPLDEPARSSSNSATSRGHPQATSPGTGGSARARAAGRAPRRSSSRARWSSSSPHGRGHGHGRRDRDRGPQEASLRGGGSEETAGRVERRGAPVRRPPIWNEIARTRIHRQPGLDRGTSGCAGRSGRSPRRSSSAPASRGRHRDRRPVSAGPREPLGDFWSPRRSGAGAACTGAARRARLDRVRLGRGSGADAAAGRLSPGAGSHVAVALGSASRIARQTRLARRRGRPHSPRTLVPRDCPFRFTAGHGLEALRVDVDDGRQAGAAHRRRGRRGRSRAACVATARGRRSSRRAARGSGRAAAAAAPGRAARRPDARRAAPRAPAHDRSEVGPGDDDPHQVPERRVAELAPPLELPGQEPRRRRGARRGRSARASGWNVCTITRPRRIAAAPPRELGDQLERPLLGAEVRHREPGVRVDRRRRARRPAKWWPFATICVPSRTTRSAAAKRCSAAVSSSGFVDRVGVEADQLELRKLRARARARASASRRRAGRARASRTPGTGLGRGSRVAAVMAAQPRRRAGRARRRSSGSGSSRRRRGSGAPARCRAGSGAGSPCRRARRSRRARRAAAPRAGSPPRGAGRRRAPGGRSPASRPAELEPLERSPSSPAAASPSRRRRPRPRAPPASRRPCARRSAGSESCL